MMRRRTNIITDSVPTLLAGDSFNRADGALGNTEIGTYSWSATAAWSISTNKVTTNPELSANLVINGTFDADTDWTKGTGWTIEGGVAKRAATPVSATSLTQNGTGSTFKNGLFYRTNTRVAGNHAVSVGGQEMPLTGSLDTIYWGKNTDQVAFTSGVWGYTEIDAVNVQRLTLTDVFATINPGIADITVAADFVIAYKLHTVGLVLCMDDPANPQNFVVVQLLQDNYGANRINVAQCLSGVITTSVLSDADTVQTTSRLTVSKVDKVLHIYHNGNLRALWEMNAALAMNTNHGLINSSNLNSITNFMMYKSGSPLQLGYPEFRMNRLG